MGLHTRATCSHCSYQVDLFEGLGGSTSHEIKVCLDCQQVVNVVTWIESGAPTKTIPPNLCPHCRGSDLSAWEKEHPCPKCQHPMIEINIGIWD